MPKAFNILHISFHKDWRGGEQQATYLIDECMKKNCFQWVLCSKGNAMEKYCKDHGLPSYSLKTGFFQNFSNRRILTDIVLRHHIDIIHVHDSKAHTLAYMSCNAGLKKAVVVHRRVDFPVKNNYFSKKKYNMDCIQKFICVSHTVKEVLEPSVEDKSKLAVVHSGIDLSKFEGKSNKGILRKEFNISPETKIIGNTSALADHKDYFTFVDTAQEVISKGFDAKFVIIGDGPEKDEIVKYIQTQNLQDHIYLTGFRNDVTDILPELDLFLMTSKTEGLGTSLLDAIACKVPLVATRAGGIPEIISHNKNGLLAEVGNPKELANHILRLFENNRLRNDLVANATETLMSFTKEGMAEKVFNIYKEIYYSAT